MEAEERQARERRRQARVRLAVPVLCGKAGGPDRGRRLPWSGWSKDLSMEGVYAMLREGNGMSPGEIVAVDVEIPWEARRAFPFSRMAGTARVLRVDQLASPANNPVWGVALAFCPDVTRLRAMAPA